MQTNKKPEFGILNGVKILSVSTMIAGPFAPGLFADHGADVIHVESANQADTMRAFGNAWAMEHRNQRTIALDVPSPEGKEIICKLLKDTDIFFESSKALTWTKWGLSDEVLWEINPALVIVHVSGFGQTGDPEYLTYTSYDPIGQAFSGFMCMNGMPEPLPPMSVGPYASDYYTGFTAAWSSLAALHRATKTGKGESIDVTQFESQARCSSGYTIDGFNNGVKPLRRGNDHMGLMVNKCSDGQYVVIVPVGPTILRNMLGVLGLQDDPDYVKLPPILPLEGPPPIMKFHKTIKEFCDNNTAYDVEQAFRKAQVPCSLVMEFDDMLKNPHYIARDTIVEWNDPKLGNIKGIGVVPKFVKHPGQIVTGSPTYGMHNEEVLSELGYSEQDIKELYAKKVINK